MMLRSLASLRFPDQDPHARLQRKLDQIISEPDTTRLFTEAIITQRNERRYWSPFSGTPR
jgi:dsDNA-specific endonuclease/ATPase MutS2